MVQEEQISNPNEEKKSIEENEIENRTEEESEKYKGRDWGKILLGVAFIFLVVVIWYVIDLFVP